MKKILIIAGGGIKHMMPFEEASKDVDAKVMVASTSDLEYNTAGGGDFNLTVKGEDVADFDICYIRVVGKRSEDVSLLVNYCKQHNIKLSDRMFERDDLIRIPITKSVEGKLLYEGGVPFPKTYFGSLKNIKENAPKIFGYPFVIKGTTGKQGNAVWSPRNEKELEKLYEKLKDKDLKGNRFLAQEFIEASQRNRIFILGGKAIAGITRPTRWRRRFLDKVDGEFPEGKRHALDPIPDLDRELSEKAAKVLGVDVGGVDVIYEDKTGNAYILEVNSAPRWASVKEDTGIDIEKEILNWLLTI